MSSRRLAEQVVICALKEAGRHFAQSSAWGGITTAYSADSCVIARLAPRRGPSGLDQPGYERVHTFERAPVRNWQRFSALLACRGDKRRKDEIDLVALLVARDRMDEGS